MKYQRERLLMAASLLALPGLLVGVGIYPTLRRTATLRTQIQVAEEAYKTLPTIHPLSAEERRLLGDPQAPWRTRLPLVVGDQARLAHYSRVVGELQQTLGKAGVAAGNMRSSWDPIRASFTLPGNLPEVTSDLGPSKDAPELKVSGWVLEVGIPGTTERLFRALGTVDQVKPLVEPVGLRWTATPERRDQQLLLRNLILTP